MKFGLIEQLSFEIKSLKENYPKFVTSNSVKKIENEIPVFVFHTVKPDEFEEQLKFISANGYKTLSINEYHDIIIKRKKTSKNILLTFDDGRSSFWRIAFPYLKKLKLKATLFVIPGITENREPMLNLENVWQNKITNNEFVKIDEDDKQYCSWEELKIMYDSGLVDIESHTLMHKVVFTGTEVTGFIDNFTHDSILTAHRNTNEIKKGFNKEKYFGLPVFKHEPMLKGNVNFYINHELVSFCKDFYDVHKTELDWQKQLLEELKKLEFKKIKKKTIVEVKKEIEKDFLFSAKLIKEQINSKAGNHLCLPWTVGSDIAIDLAEKTNYQSVFWGATQKKTNKPGDNPFYNCRIKNDFIFRLPGKGKKSVLSIYASKVTRRLKGKAIY